MSQPQNRNQPTRTPTPVKDVQFREIVDLPGKKLAAAVSASAKITIEFLPWAQTFEFRSNGQVKCVPASNVVAWTPAERLG